MPIFSTDKEAASGIPTLATDFYAKLGSADLLESLLRNITVLIPQHLKNILTGLRIHAKTFREKQTLILATFQDQEEKLCFRNCKKSFSFSRCRCQRKFFTLPSFMKILMLKWNH
jgi:hypothetical protein